MALYRDFPGNYATSFTNTAGGNAALPSNKLFIGSTADDASGALLQVNGGVTVTGLLTQTFTGTTTNAYAITANSLTSGNALTLSTNALTSGRALYISSTSTSRNGSLISVVSSGNGIGITKPGGITSSVTNTGASSTNLAFYATASGADTNYSYYSSSGIIRQDDSTDNTLGTVDSGSIQTFGGVGIAKNLTVGTGLQLNTNAGLTMASGTGTFAQTYLNSSATASSSGFAHSITSTRSGAINGSGDKDFNFGLRVVLNRTSAILASVLNDYGIYSSVTGQSIASENVYAGYFTSNMDSVSLVGTTYGVYTAARYGATNYSLYSSAGLIYQSDPTDNTLGTAASGSIQTAGGVGIAKNLTVGTGLTLNEGTFTQTFTGTTINAHLITANSLTTGKALTISANALTSGNAISASSTSTGRITASSLLSIASSGANASASIEARGISSTVVNTGTTSTNTAIYSSASGASTNYSFYGSSGTLYNSGNLVIGTTTLDSTSSLRGVSRSSDGGTWLHGLPTGSISAYSNGTNSVNINRYAYSGFDGFVASNGEFYGVCQDHQYGGPGAQYSIISTGRISFFAGTPTLQANGAYQVPLVGSWITTGLSISGSLSKGSGSFRIEHPLPELSDKHDLVHSFIEGPKADLIYRGKVQLEDGKAIVNIDTVSKMTEGTFVLLCRDIDCFVTNNSSWTQVKGSVTGNLLSIVSNDNTSTDIVTWMVIGERQDKHMYDTGWTDDEGHVVVEPLKQD